MFKFIKNMFEETKTDEVVNEPVPIVEENPVIEVVEPKAVPTMVKDGVVVPNLSEIGEGVNSNTM